MVTEETYFGISPVLSLGFRFDTEKGGFILSTKSQSRKCPFQIQQPSPQITWKEKAKNTQVSCHHGNEAQHSMMWDV